MDWLSKHICVRGVCRCSGCRYLVRLCTQMGRLKMSEWIEYTGSDEQIKEMRNAEHGFVVRDNENNNSDIISREEYLSLSNETLRNVYLDIEVTHYLICSPHPLVDMIKRQCRTGQPVWIKVPYIPATRSGMNNLHCSDSHCFYSITTPDWDIPGAEYSFAPFEEGK